MLLYQSDQSLISCCLLGNKSVHVLLFLVVVCVAKLFIALSTRCVEVSNHKLANLLTDNVLHTCVYALSLLAHSLWFVFDAHTGVRVVVTRTGIHI